MTPRAAVGWHTRPRSHGAREGAHLRVRERARAHGDAGIVAPDRRRSGGDAGAASREAVPA